MAAVGQSLADFGASRANELDGGEFSGGGASQADLTQSLSGNAAPPSGGQAGPAGTDTRTNGQGAPEGTGGSAPDPLAELGIGTTPQGAPPEAGKSGTADGAFVAPLELKVAGETVIGQVDGKDITAAELKNGYMRHGDYTRKNQEFAEYRKQADPAVQFVTDPRNVPVLDKLAQAGVMMDGGNADQGKALALEAFKLAAKDFGLDLVSADDAKARGRDSVTGRFTPKAQAEHEQELSALEEEFGKDSVAYRSAVRTRELEERLAALESASDGRVKALETKLGEFTSGLERAHQLAQTREAVEQLASGWTEKGVQGLATEPALGLVGKTITPDQAMMLANYGQIIAWAVSKAVNRPNEPGRQAPGGLDPGAMSLTEYANARVR